MLFRHRNENFRKQKCLFAANKAKAAIMHEHALHAGYHVFVYSTRCPRLLICRGRVSMFFLLLLLLLLFFAVAAMDLIFYHCLTDIYVDLVISKCFFVKEMKIFKKRNVFVYSTRCLLNLVSPTVNLSWTGLHGVFLQLQQ